MSDTIKGVMLNDAHLLGTSLRLEKGQVVALVPATNIPGGGFFAKPFDGKWSDGIERSEDNSIHFSPNEVNQDILVFDQAVEKLADAIVTVSKFVSTFDDMLDLAQMVKRNWAGAHLLYRDSRHIVAAMMLGIYGDNTSIGHMVNGQFDAEAQELENL